MGLGFLICKWGRWLVCPCLVGLHREDTDRCGDHSPRHRWQDAAQLALPSASLLGLQLCPSTFLPLPSGVGQYLGCVEVQTPGPGCDLPAQGAGRLPWGIGPVPSCRVTAPWAPFSHCKVRGCSEARPPGILKAGWGRVCGSWGCVPRSSGTPVKAGPSRPLALLCLRPGATSAPCDHTTDPCPERPVWGSLFS